MGGAVGAMGGLSALVVRFDKGGQAVHGIHSLYLPTIPGDTEPWLGRSVKCS